MKAAVEEDANFRDKQEWFRSDQSKNSMLGFPGSRWMGLDLLNVWLTLPARLVLTALPRYSRLEPAVNPPKRTRQDHFDQSALVSQ